MKTPIFRKLLVGALILINAPLVNAQGVRLGADSDWRQAVKEARYSNETSGDEVLRWTTILSRKASSQEIEMIIGEIANTEDLYDQSASGKIHLTAAVNEGLLAYNDPKVIADAILKYEFAPSVVKMIGLFEFSYDSSEQRYNLSEVLEETARRTLNPALKASIYDQIEAIEVNFRSED